MSKQEILRVAIETMPRPEPAWFDVLSALLTPVIALIAIYIAYQQYKINQQRLRHETYERRLHVYKALQKFLSEFIIKDDEKTYDRCNEFYSEVSEAAFLFDDTVQNRIDEIREKYIRMVYLHEELNRPNGSPGLLSRDEKNEVAHENKEILLWLTGELRESKSFFAEKLGLKGK